MSAKTKKFMKSLPSLSLSGLESIAQEQSIAFDVNLDRNQLIEKIIESYVVSDDALFSSGVLEVEESDEGDGVIRVHNCFPSVHDCFVPNSVIKKYGLLHGDGLCFSYTEKKNKEYARTVDIIHSVNELLPIQIKDRPQFSDLTPVYPSKQLKLETDEENLSGRMLDVFAPIGYGQRALIVSPPKAGKTSIMKGIANSIAANHPESIIKVLLIDERPEEVTDMKRSVRGSVVYSTFDEAPHRHVRIAELVFENAKRLVESGKDVVILLDSITRLARAYNLVVSPSGRTLSGGLDPNSLHKPKRFFGGARQIESGGSLTIIATALVNTGSRMDDIIYEEFKGTGNMELHLDRNLANRLIFPAIDIMQSSTRKSELLLAPDLIKKIQVLRKNLREDSLEELIKLLKQSESNVGFFNSPLFR
jgi:transcription termination factor Rho